MKLSRLRTLGSQKNADVEYAPGLIRVRDPRVIGDPEICRRFVQQVFALAEIQSVELDNLTATIRYPASQCDAATILSRVAAALATHDSGEPSPRLRKLLAQARERTITICRNGNAYSTAVKRQPAPARGLRRLAYLAFAAGSLGMAIVGAIVPGIPTVPFVLLTSYYLVQSSPALNARLLRSRIFGPMLRDWNEHRALRPRVKVITLGIMMLVVGATLFLGDFPFPILIVILLMVCLGLYSVWRIPTLREVSKRPSTLPTSDRDLSLFRHPVAGLA